MATFSLTISNTDNHSAITVDNSSSYNDWRIPNDGLSGFGSVPFSSTQAELATTSGGVSLGGHSGIRQLIIKLVALPTAARREEAYKVLTVGSTVTMTVAYLRSESRTISGMVTNCKVSEGNIYEPMTVTATIDCADPFFRSADKVISANGETYGSGKAGLSWIIKSVDGDSLSRLKSASLFFYTPNTESVTLSQQAHVMLQITQNAAYGSYGIPKVTTLGWNAGPKSGTTIEAKTPITWEVHLDGKYPVCVYNGTVYGMESAELDSFYSYAWDGFGRYEMIGNASCTVTLLIEMSKNILPNYISTSKGFLTYTPGWQGV